jgi:SagB-type dehydrogenase family enzyme
MQISKTWMRISIASVLLLILGLIIWLVCGQPGRSDHTVTENDPQASSPVQIIDLPEPDRQGHEALEKLLNQRRSVREYAAEHLSLQEISQVLWAAQGLSDSPHAFRTVPSAGALYPLEIYLVAGDIESLAAGVYRYMPREHALVLIVAGDVRNDLYASALSQEPIRKAPATLVIAAVYERTTQRYGDRGRIYVHMEAGHAGQNIYLQAEAIDLATVAIGAFQDQDVKTVLGMAHEEEPLYIFPLGRKIQPQK